MRSPEVENSIPKIIQMLPLFFKLWTDLIKFDELYYQTSVEIILSDVCINGKRAKCYKMQILYFRKESSDTFTFWKFIRYLFAPCSAFLHIQLKAGENRWNTRNYLHNDLYNSLNQLPMFLSFIFGWNVYDKNNVYCVFSHCCASLICWI